ncbi:MAG: FGGY family carbohydrate kinase [Patescibacteria group bacterium]
MNILVINLGLRSVRAIVFNERGDKLAQSWYPVRTIIKGERVEQDPNEWWRLGKEVIKEALADQEIKKDIQAVTVTSSACFLVLMDKDGNALGNSMIVSDKRSQKQAEMLKNDSRFSDIFSSPNNLAVASYLIPKMIWLKENEPEIFNKTAKFISANDFFIYKLSGRYATDPLNAEKFYYNADTKSYPASILQYLNINKERLPEVLPIGFDLGNLREELKVAWGFDHKVKVILSTYDAICAFWGAGVHEPGQACNVCGTVTSFRVLSPKSCEAKFGVLSQNFFNTTQENAYIVGGSNNLDGGLLEWAKEVFYGDAYPEKYIFNIMEDEATLSRPGAHGLIFLPYLLGERMPFYDANVRGMFFGLERHHSRKDLIRSVFESSGFLAMSIMEAIESLGVNVNQIRLSGGLSRNNLISQIRADITGRDVYLIEETETTALGAFMILGVSLGIFSDFKAAAQNVKIKKIFTPDLSAHEKYQHLYGLFKDLYNDTNKSFKKRLELLNKIKTEEDQFIIDNL